MNTIEIYPWAFTVSYFFLTLALVLATFRLIKGPSVYDRILALDLISALVMSFAVVFSMETKNPVFLEISLCIAIIAFIGTIAFAKFLGRRKEQ